MLSRLIALPLQLIIAWFAAPVIVAFMPTTGWWEMFAYAVLFAVLVWIVGVVSAEVMQADLPSSGMLVAAVSLATIGAALAVWLPSFIPDASTAMRKVPDQAYPLIGAVLGYQIGRLPSGASSAST
jgi:hypothetical protein